jgi:hypothetical protein
MLQQPLYRIVVFVEHSALLLQSATKLIGKIVGLLLQRVQHGAQLVANLRTRSGRGSGNGRGATLGELSDQLA